MSLLVHHNPPGGNFRRVFIAVPCYGSPSGITAFSLFCAHPKLLQAGWEVEFALLLGDCHVDDARNRLVNDFLNSSCTDLVFIDADVGFEAEDLVRLLSHDRDVVGGTYPKKDDLEVHTAVMLGGEIWSDKDGLIEVKALPGGFTRIRRNVLEKLAEDSAEYQIESNPAKIKQIFERKIINGVKHSSDIVFCVKWREKGGKIYADPDLYLQHQGSKIWSGTLGSHLRKINGLALSELKKISTGQETDKTYIDLMLEWGNVPWAATPELVKTSVMVARQLDGPVLEAGTGLTTLAMAAANPRITIHALEHDYGWSEKVLQDARRMGLANVKVHCADLSQYPNGRWYSPPELPWGEFQAVLCDGPPRTHANRKILFDVMEQNGCKPKCVLMDDEEESIPGFRTEIRGQQRKFAVGLR